MIRRVASALRAKPWARAVLLGLVGLSVLVGTYVFVLPQFADYDRVWKAARTLSWTELLLLAGVVVLNLSTFAPPWMAALPGLRFRQAFVLTQASTASTYVAPGGAAVGAGLSLAMLRAWGFSVRASALAATVTGAWNQLFALGAPAVALALLTLLGGDGAALQSVALLGFAVFVVVVASFALGLSSAHAARRVGDRAAALATRAKRLIRRGPVPWSGADFARFRGEAIGLLRRRWHVLTLATLAGQLTVFLVLLTCLRVLGAGGGELSVVEVFAAWSLARLLGSIPITPGGLGFVEVGLTTVLVAFGGSNAHVVAAVLLYRILTVIPTLVLGLAGAASWRRHAPERAQEATVAASESG